MFRAGVRVHVEGYMSGMGVEYMSRDIGVEYILVQGYRGGVHVLGYWVPVEYMSRVIWVEYILVQGCRGGVHVQGYMGGVHTCPGL